VLASRSLIFIALIKRKKERKKERKKQRKKETKKKTKQVRAGLVRRLIWVEE